MTPALTPPPALTLTLALALTACNSLGGSLTSSASPLGTWTFTPTRCTGNASGLALSSQSDPLRYVAIEREPAASVPDATSHAPSILAPSILAPQTARYRMVVLDLGAPDGSPLVVPSTSCSVLWLQASSAFSTRINAGPWVTSYAGTAEIDCDEHRLVGRFDFTCPEQ